MVWNFLQYLRKFEKLLCQFLDGTCNVTRNRLSFSQFLLYSSKLSLRRLVTFCSVHCNFTEQEVRKSTQEVRKTKMKFCCIRILQQLIGTRYKFPQGICKEFFKFAKVMRKIVNELGTQERNASRGLPVKLKK